VQTYCLWTANRPNQPRKRVVQHMTQEDQGETFSHFYLRPAQATGLTAKMRVRLLAGVQRIWGGDTSGAARAIREHVGVATNNLTNFFQQAEEADVLSGITAIFRHIREIYGSMPSIAVQWLTHVQTVFSEEHASYTIGAKGEVRYLHDEEFARSSTATISQLGKPRYANARNLF